MDERTEASIEHLIERTRRTAETQYKIISEKNPSKLYYASVNCEHGVDAFLMFINGSSLEQIQKKYEVSREDVEKNIFLWLNFCDQAIKEIKEKEAWEYREKQKAEGEKEAILHQKKWETDCRIREEFQEKQQEKKRQNKAKLQETRRIEIMQKHLDKLDEIISKLSKVDT